MLRGVRVRMNVPMQRRCELQAKGKEQMQRQQPADDPTPAGVAPVRPRLWRLQIHFSFPRTMNAFLIGSAFMAVSLPHYRCVQRQT